MSAQQAKHGIIPVMAILRCFLAVLCAHLFARCCEEKPLIEVGEGRGGFAMLISVFSILKMGTSRIYLYSNQT